MKRFAGAVADERPWGREDLICWTHDSARFDLPVAGAPAKEFALPAADLASDGFCGCDEFLYETSVRACRAAACLSGDVDVED